MSRIDRAVASPSRPAKVSRRLFVGASPLLVAALAGCTRAFVDQARIAESFIVDPEWSAYRPILRGLMRVILPLDDARFPPLTLDQIERRLVRMFPLENERRFLGFQRTLTLFNQVDLFPLVSGPLLLEEEKARDLEARGDQQREWVTALREEEERAYAAFRERFGIHESARFDGLPHPLQDAYFDLWRDSASVVKRAFAGAIRSVVIITVYSDDAAWPAIGYEGPLLDRPEKPQ